MAPTILNYGMGVDSTAMLIELVERGEAPDLIIFADTGSEKPETYAYLPIIEGWLQDRGLELTIVRRGMSRPSKTGPGYDTIEGQCLQNKTLPSLAFGHGKCSLKWKAQPMDKWLNSWGPAMLAWANGEKVVKLIGYDCSRADLRRSKRGEKRIAVNGPDPKFIFHHPLQRWGWTRPDCIERIERAGLLIPPKSACFFCPASKPEELRDMAETNPELFARAIAIEDNAQVSLTSIPGLWRKQSWRGWAEAEGLIESKLVQIAPVAVAVPQMDLFSQGVAA
jgi:hypothetical protein